MKDLLDHRDVTQLVKHIEALLASATRVCPLEDELVEYALDNVCSNRYMAITGHLLKCDLCRESYTAFVEALSDADHSIIQDDKKLEPKMARNLYDLIVDCGPPTCWTPEHIDLPDRNPRPVDDRAIRLSDSILVHSTVRGPARGGIRYPAATEQGTGALAFWMSLKTTLVNMAFDGGKAIVRRSGPSLGGAKWPTWHNLHPDVFESVDTHMEHQLGFLCGVSPVRLVVHGLWDRKDTETDCFVSYCSYGVLGSESSSQHTLMSMPMEHMIRLPGAFAAIDSAWSDIPFGSDKGSVVADPRSLSDAKLERLSRRYFTELPDLFGIDKEVPAPDLVTNPQAMAWIMDTYCVPEEKLINFVVDEIESDDYVPITRHLLKCDSCRESYSIYAKGLRALNDDCPDEAQTNGPNTSVIAIPIMGVEFGILRHSCRLSSRDLAKEDAAQDVWIRTFANSEAVNVRAYTCFGTIARNVRKNYARKRKHQSYDGPVGSEMDRHLQVTTYPPRANALEEFLALQGTNEDEALLVLRGEGSDMREIADLLKSNLATVRTRLARLICKIRNFQKKRIEE